MQARGTGCAKLLLVLLLVNSANPNDLARTERVHFEAGKSAARIEGSIVGGETVDYLVGARAGQTMTVTLDTSSTAAFFNLIPPDEASTAIFIGSIEGMRFQGELDLDGDWKVRVYQMRSAARRGEQATFTIDVAVIGSPDPAKARAANDFGPRAWDARGKLGCAIGGQPMQTAKCLFKVVRYRSDIESGATVFVLNPDNSTERILYFLNGDWRSDSTATVSTQRRADIWLLSVADETYEIPEAVLSGG